MQIRLLTKKGGPIPITYKKDQLQDQKGRNYTLYRLRRLRRLRRECLRHKNRRPRSPVLVPTALSPRSVPGCTAGVDPDGISDYGSYVASVAGAYGTRTGKQACRFSCLRRCPRGQDLQVMRKPIATVDAARRMPAGMHSLASRQGCTRLTPGTSLPSNRDSADRCAIDIATVRKERCPRIAELPRAGSPIPRPLKISRHIFRIHIRSIIGRKPQRLKPLRTASDNAPALCALEKAPGNRAGGWEILPTRPPALFDAGECPC